MTRVIKFIKRNWILIGILGLALFLRLYNFQAYFNYGHDQDLIGWFIKDVLVNNHLRLIGQQTSSMGVFIGPYFYYLLIPFYLITSMDPIGGIILVTILGMASVFSFYWVFNKIFNRTVGLIAASIYATSFLITFVDREVAPTMPVMLWTIWYFYGLWSILKGKSKTYLLMGLLLGLIWDLNLALLLLTPLIPLAQVLSKKKLSFKFVITGIAIFFIAFSPYIAFEVRHGFSQTKSIVSSLTTSKDYGGGSKPGLAKLDRVMQIVNVNTTRVFWGTEYPKNLVRLTFFALIGVLALLIWKKKLPKELTIIAILWQILFVVFFTVNSINISEYYLNGMNVIWIMVVSLGIYHISKQKSPLKYLGLILVVFIALNLRSFTRYSTNGNGYVEKKALTSFIKEDAGKHNFPCVAVSYITAPGYNFGFRYFLWQEGIKTKRPLSGAPIYSIVFPLSYVDGFDKRFGGLGLILPDYKSYTGKSVEKACEGDDENLSESMFGYTQ
jgi:hypothetical protein